MDEPPIAHGDGVPSMLADDAWVVGVCAEVLLSHGLMKNRDQEFIVSRVLRRGAGLFAESKHVGLIQSESARQCIGYLEV